MSVPSVSKTRKRNVVVQDDRLRHLDDLVAVRLYRLGEMVGRVASLAFEERYGTRITELRILSLLHEDERITVAEVSRRARIDKAWISRLVRTMEHHGLVQRESDPGDSRTALISLTAAGRALQDELLPLSLVRERFMLDGVKRNDLMTLLDRLELNIQRLLDAGGQIP